MTICSRCKLKPAREKQRYCLTCFATYMRSWRKNHQPTEEQRQKDVARSYAGTYKRRGKISTEPCVVCGNPAEMHHPDYAKPTVVVWYCKKHHQQLHNWMNLIPT